jgi:hypothetical protein
MKKWEYETCACKDADDLVEILNELGKDGWELVSVVFVHFPKADESQGDYLEAFLKREG